TSVITNSATSSISFTTAGTERMTVTSAGNVGIGTAAPTKPLEVNGHVQAQGNFFANNGSFVAQTSGVVYGLVGAGSNSVDGSLKLSNNAGTDFGRLQFGGTTSSYPSLKRNATQIDIRLADDSGFAGLAAGTIGIGTTAPNQTLSVSGTANITSSTMIGSTVVPSATLDVSGTLRMAGTGSEACGPTTYGIMRRNPSTGHIEICRQ
ncbi:MAG: hypothetical protein ABL907_21940, partial [Hyphomicrobium sp.]